MYNRSALNWNPHLKSIQRGTKLKEKDISNDYLANICSTEYWKAAEAQGLETEGN